MITENMAALATLKWRLPDASLGAFMRVSAGIVLSLLAFAAFGRAAASFPCNAIVVDGELSAGERFWKSINKDLEFRIDPHQIGPTGNISSWEISLVRTDDATRDYIYPVNPPMRFNPLQILGPAYGEDTQESLSHPHLMRYLLSAKDYDRLWPFVTNVLWPYQAPDADNAGDQYVSVLKSLVTGELNLTVLSYTADPATGSIQHISFRAEFTAPQSFAFDQALAPEPTDCAGPLVDVRAEDLPQQRERAQQTNAIGAESLGEKDTIAAAKLSAKEQREVIDAMERSAFDMPDSWEKELRAKRVDLGGSPGIVLQGTKLLCGGTGNCQLFMLRKVNDEWASLFGDEQAPLAESFHLGPGVTHGIKDLTVSTNSSAEASKRTIYKFNGQRYAAISASAH